MPPRLPVGGPGSGAPHRVRVPGPGTAAHPPWWRADYRSKLDLTGQAAGHVIPLWKESSMDSQLTVVARIDPVARCRTGAAPVPVSRPSGSIDTKAVAA